MGLRHNSVIRGFSSHLETGLKTDHPQNRRKLYNNCLHAQEAKGLKMKHKADVREDFQNSSLHIYITFSYCRAFKRVSLKIS